MFENLKKFFARFYSDKPAMLMPAVPHTPEDEDHTVEQQRAAALMHQTGNDDADDDQDLPPPMPSG